MFTVITRLGPLGCHSRGHDYVVMSPQYAWLTWGEVRISDIILDWHLLFYMFLIVIDDLEFIMYHKLLRCVTPLWGESMVIRFIETSTKFVGMFVRELVQSHHKKIINVPVGEGYPPLTGHISDTLPSKAFLYTNMRLIILLQLRPRDLFEKGASQIRLLACSWLGNKPLLNLWWHNSLFHTLRHSTSMSQWVKVSFKIALLICYIVW